VDDTRRALDQLERRELSAVVVVDEGATTVHRTDATPASSLASVQAALGSGGDVVVERSGDRPRSHPVDYAPVAGVAFFVLLSSTAASGELVDGRVRGTFKRMVTAPASPVAIVIGETVARVAIAALSAVCLLVATSVLLGTDWGALPRLALAVAVLCIACAGLAGILGAVARTMEQSALLSIVAGAGLGFVGGAVLPSDALPAVLRPLGMLTPSYWFVESLTTTDGALGALVPLTIVAIAVTLIATVLWRSQADRAFA
jgi:ABC-type multidrug transport system permease subunit